MKHHGKMMTKADVNQVFDGSLGRGSCRLPYPKQSYDR